MSEKPAYSQNTHTKAPSTERPEKRPVRQRRPGWQPAQAGPAPNTVDSGALSVRALETDDRATRIWTLRTKHCLSIRDIAQRERVSTVTVMDSLRDTMAERTHRLAGETDAWRQAQTERYAALRTALERTILDPEAPSRDVSLAVQTALRLERDLADLWGLRVQTGRDALAEAVADVVKARVKHGRDQRREQGVYEEQNARRDVQVKKTNRAGAFIEGHPTPPPQSVAELLDCEIMDPHEAHEAALAKGDLELPTLPLDGKPDRPGRHKLVIKKEVRAVLESRLGGPAVEFRKDKKAYKSKGGKHEG